MPNQILDRGHTANIGAGTIATTLQVIGVGATYTLTIGGNPPVAFAVPPGGVNTHAINGQAVSVTNTSPPGGPPNMTLSW